MSHVYAIHSFPSVSSFNHGGRAARNVALALLRAAILAFALIGLAHLVELALQSFAVADSGVRISAVAPTHDYASADVDQFRYFPEQFANRGTDIESPTDQF